MGRAYKIADAVILVICLPFYALAIPLVLAHDWLMRRRGVRLGQGVTHFPARDVREDYIVVDVSRLQEGLVGIRRRTWYLRGGREAPPFSEDIEYIRRDEFWVPRRNSS